MREKLINKLHVIGLQLLDAGDVIALAVQVVGIKRVDGLEHVPVLVAHELAVGALAVPGVEGVVADHGEGLLGQGGLVADDVVEVLVVAPAEHDVVEAASLGVDAELGAVHGVSRVRVGGKRLGEDDALVKGAADGEGVADNVPLALRLEVFKEDHELAQVVDEAGDLHPARLAVAADGLGRLQEVLNLGERRVRVRLVDERVELLHGFPDGHFGPDAGRRVEAVARGEVVGYRLLLVLLLVKVLDAVARRLVLAERVLVLGGVELRLLVVLDAVDVVDEVGHFLELLADGAAAAVELLGGEGARGGDFVDGRGCHCDCLCVLGLCVYSKRVV